jgi:hypothetical protein
LNRLPLNVDVIWLQHRPEIRIKIADSTRGEVVFRADDTAELLGKVVNAYAHALVTMENMKLENRALREIHAKN